MTLSTQILSSLILFKTTLAKLPKGKVWLIVEHENFREGSSHYDLHAPMDHATVVKMVGTNSIPKQCSNHGLFYNVKDANTRHISQRYIQPKDQRQRGGTLALVVDVLSHPHKTEWSSKASGIFEGNKFHSVNALVRQGFEAQNKRLNRAIQATRTLDPTAELGDRMKCKEYDPKHYPGNDQTAFYLRSEAIYARNLKDASCCCGPKLKHCRIPLNPDDPRGWFHIPMVLRSSKVRQLRASYRIERLEGRANAYTISRIVCSGMYPCRKERAIPQAIFISKREFPLKSSCFEQLRDIFFRKQ